MLFCGQVPAPELESRWAAIPAGVDILVSHMPPFAVCDMNGGGVRSGSRSLWTAVSERMRPRLHVFGHIHEGYGHKAGIGGENNEHLPVSDLLNYANRYR
jgi:Icc-related predicted phosphoesterase